MSDAIGSSLFRNVVYRISSVCNLVGSLFIFCMMLFTTIDVILRSVANRPITGAVEGTQLMMLLAVALGLAYTQFKKGHISVELLVSRFPRMARSINNVFVSLVCLGVYGIIAWQAIVGGLRQQGAGVTISDVIRIPVHPFYYVLAFGSVILCLVYVLDILADFRTLRRGPNK
jgi:TRAP-type transport system small permease protein